MKSFEVRVFFDRDGRAMACSEFDGKRHTPIALADDQLDVLADVATVSACRKAAAKAEREEA